MPDANALAELAINIKDGHDRSSPSGESTLSSSTTAGSNVTSSASQNVATSQAASDNQPAPKCEIFSMIILTSLIRLPRTKNPINDDQLKWHTLLYHVSRKSW